MNLQKGQNTFAVVVTYNAETWLELSLGSLKNAVSSIKTVVVDNASTDRTIELLEKNYPEVHLITLEKNLGFGRANNIGIRYALENGADHIFLLNQDAEMEPDTAAVLAGLQNRYPEYGVLSPIHLDGNGDGFDAKFARFALKISGKEHRLFKKWDKKRNLDSKSVDTPDDLVRSTHEILPVHYVNAAAWMISRQCLRQIGGFHPLFFMYGEDDEYLNRMKLGSYLVGVVPSTAIRHHRDQHIALEDDWAKIKNINFFASAACVIMTNNRLSAYEKRRAILLQLSKGLRRNFWRKPFQSIMLFFGRILRLIKISVDLAKIPEKENIYAYLNIDMNSIDR